MLISTYLAPVFTNFKNLSKLVLDLLVNICVSRFCFQL